MKKLKRSIISTLLTAVLCALMGMNVQAVTVEEAQQAAEALEAEKNAAQAEKSALDSELNRIAAEMKETKEKLNQKQEEITVTESEYVQAKIDENNQYESMKKRIVFMYENGTTQFIELLMSSQSIGDLLSKAEYISRISAYDRDMLVQFQDTVQEVADKEASLKNEYASLDMLQTELIGEQTEVEYLLKDKDVQIADLQGRIGENAALLEELIAQAEAERIRQEEAARAAAAPPVNNNNVSGGGYNSPVDNIVVSGGGAFCHPCPSAMMSSTFGWRDFDNSFHNGVDFAAPEGTPTYAGDAGTVIIAGYSFSAGNWVVINHGNGFVTKYMHHSALAVSPGEQVARGQLIGYVGNTGNSFGAHLHFQVELNGVPVNPLGYL